VRRVDRWELHPRHPDLAAVVEELAAQRLAEAFGGVLGGAVGRLERNRTERQPRSDLDDHAGVPGAHPPQRRQRAVDGAEVGDFGDPADLGGGEFGDRGEHRHHGVVHPHVDRPELALDGRGRRLHLVGVGHIDGHHLRAPARSGDVGCSRGEPIGPAGQQRHPGAAAGEGDRCGPPHAC